MNDDISQVDMAKMVERIIDLDDKMRFAAIIDIDGNVISSIIKSGKQSLKSQKEEERFCRQVAQRRNMREEFDLSLGTVNYVHVEREKLTQIAMYVKKYTVYFTTEPEFPMEETLIIITKVKKIISALDL